MNHMVSATTSFRGASPAENVADEFYDVGRWHGMSGVEAEILAAVTGEKVNGWAITALFQGPQAVSARLVGRMETYSIVSGLLVAMGVTLMIAPTARTLSTLADRDEGALELFFYIGYAFLGIATLTLYFAVIVLATLFTSILRAAARDADTWRIIVRNGKLPSLVDTLFASGNIGVTLLMALSILPDFGFVTSSIFACVIIVIVGISMLFFNKVYLQSAGHPIGGWKKYHRDEWDLDIALQTVSTLASTDRDRRSK